MSKSINHDMIKISELMELLACIRSELNNANDILVVDRIEKSIAKLKTRRRLVVIDGGKT